MYTEQSFNLPTLSGLSAKQIEVHLALYAGYVKNVNALNDKIASYKIDSKEHALALSELTRRYAFEFNGMRLHELYFEAFGEGETPQRGVCTDGELTTALAKQYGSVENWKAEITAVAMMRGIGWALLTYDKKARVFKNIWVADHEIGHLAGVDVLVAIDVWEHAFMVDYVPAERSKYLEAVFANLNWAVIDGRFKA